jgi:ankyrin repeat protein
MKQRLKKNVPHPEVARAIALDQFNEALSLIDAGVGTIDSTDKSGSTLLMRAVVCKDFPMIKNLIIHGANVSMADAMGWTALHFAASEGYFDGVKILIDNGADVNARDHDGNSPIFNAFLKTDHHKKVVDLLISKGADLSLSRPRVQTIPDNSVRSIFLPLTARFRSPTSSMLLKQELLPLSI